MAGNQLKRYGLEKVAKVLIAVGLMLVISSWAIGAYYFGVTGKSALLLVPALFTLVLAILLLVVRYRYTLFERYPYLMNLPSIFYRIGENGGPDDRSVAFSMIFTVHALVIAFLGLLSVFLTVSIGFSVHKATVSPFLYSYFAIIALLVISVLVQYRRIYRKFVK